MENNTFKCKRCGSIENDDRIITDGNDSIYGAYPVRYFKSISANIAGMELETLCYECRNNSEVKSK